MAEMLGTYGTTTEHGLSRDPREAIEEYGTKARALVRVLLAAGPGMNPSDCKETLALVQEQLDALLCALHTEEVREAA